MVVNESTVSVKFEPMAVRYAMWCVVHLLPHRIRATLLVIVNGQADHLTDFEMCDDD